MKLVKQEPCQVSKVRPKNTKTDKNKYEEIVNKYFTNRKNERIVFYMAINFINNNGGNMKLTKTEINTLLNTLLPTIHDYETLSINSEGYEKEIATERYQVLTHLYDRLTEEAK